MKAYKYRIDSQGRNAATQILPLVGDHKRVLEIGCSVGTQTRILSRELKCEVTAVEIDAGSAESAREYCKQLVIGDVESLDLTKALAEQSFDVMLLADVLEHLREPGRTLTKLRSLLAPSGFLLCCVPNVCHAAIAWEVAHGRFDYQRYGLLDDTHIRFFTRRSIEELLDSGGYIVSEVHRFRLPIGATEFPVTPASEDDLRFLSYVTTNNPESETYQFIVKAHSMGQSSQGLLPRIAKLERENEELLRRLTVADAKVKKLTSEIQWLESARAAGFLRRLLGKLR